MYNLPSCLPNFIPAMLSPCRPADQGPKGGETALDDIFELWEEEDGVTTVEIILVLLVLIALVLIFKEQMTKIVKNILSKVSSQSNSV